MANVEITGYGGQSPYQAYGFVDGRPFYFRSRGNHWTLTIWPEKSDWEYCEEYKPDQEYAAGYIKEEEFRKFLAKGVDLWEKQKSLDNGREGV